MKNLLILFAIIPLLFACQEEDVIPDNKDQKYESPLNDIPVELSRFYKNSGINYQEYQFDGGVFTTFIEGDPIDNQADLVDRSDNMTKYFFKSYSGQFEDYYTMDEYHDGEVFTTVLDKDLNVTGSYTTTFEDIEGKIRVSVSSGSGYTDHYYEKGNLVRKEYYKYDGSEFVLNEETTYEYDDKVYPLPSTKFQVPRSINNATKEVRKYDGKTYTTNYSYDYNEHDLPVKGVATYSWRPETDTTYYEYTAK